MQQTLFYWQNQNLYLNLHINPGAKQNRIIGPYDNRLKIQIAAPANDGKANTALIKFLSLYLEIPKREIKLVHGECGQNKTLCIKNASANLLTKLLLKHP